MRREDMAQFVEEMTVYRRGMDTLMAAAAELRKTCATCKWFENYDGRACGKTIGMRVIEDGSGFCHLWEPEPKP